jgi:hypothetical protein
MFFLKKQEKLMTQNDISRFYKSVLSPILDKYTQMKILRIVKDAYLLTDGNVKEKVDIVFEYVGNGNLNTFIWHIPKINENTEIAGVIIPIGTKAKGYSISQEGQLSIIEIHLQDVCAGTVVHLNFEYYLFNASTYRRGFLHNKIYYPMAFIAADTVESLDLRIYTPSVGKLKAENNLPYFRMIEDGEKHILLASSEDKIVGDFSGFVSLEYKSDYYRAFWATITGLVFAGYLRLAQLLGDIGFTYWYLTIPIVLSLLIAFLYRKFKD